MRRILRLAVLLAVIGLVVATASPAMAAPPQGKVSATVVPIIGGPDNASSFAGPPATVSIPSNNPAIWKGVDKPGKVFRAGGG